MTRPEHQTFTSRLDELSRTLAYLSNGAHNVATALHNHVRLVEVINELTPSLQIDQIRNLTVWQQAYQSGYEDGYENGHEYGCQEGCSNC